LTPPPPAAEAPAPRELELEEEAQAHALAACGLVELQADAATGAEPRATQPIDVSDPAAAEAAGDGATALPPDWPDPRGFTPARPCAERPPLQAFSDQPVLKHVKLVSRHRRDKLRRHCRATSTFATRQDLAVGSLICNVAMISFVSVVTTTSRKC
jgi:hypothetical protein